MILRYFPVAWILVAQLYGQALTSCVDSVWIRPVVGNYCGHNVNFITLKLGPNGDIYALGSCCAGCQPHLSNHDFLNLARFSKDGVEYWMRSYPPYGFPSSVIDFNNNLLSVSASNEAYIASSYYSNPESSDSVSAYVAHCDASGSSIWSAVFTDSGVSMTNVRDMVSTANGDIYLLCTCGSTSQPYTSHVTLVKYSSTGEMKWLRHYGRDEDHFSGISLALEQDSAIIACGSFSSDGRPTIFATKWTSSGDTLWQRTINIPGYDEAVFGDMTLDKNGNLIISATGYLFVLEQADLVLLKYSPGGDLLWQRSSQSRRAAFLCVDSIGDIFSSADSAFLDGTNSRAVTQKWTADGLLIWESTYAQMKTGTGAMAMGRDGNPVVVVGGAQSMILKHDGLSGRKIWVADIPDGWVGRRGLLLDDSGNAYVALEANIGGPTQLLKYPRYSTALFCDDFFAGLQASWRNETDSCAWVWDGSWPAGITTSLSGPQRSCVLSVGDTSWSNYVFDVGVRGDSGVDKVVRFRERDESTRYFLNFRGLWDGAQSIILGRQKDNSETILKIVPWQDSPGWHYLNVACMGNRIGVSENWTPVMDYVDSLDPIFAGGVGLVCYTGLFGSCKISFADVKVSELVPGDADGSGAVDISDAVYLIAYIFSGGAPPSPQLAGDANCDRPVDISDVVYLIAYIFSGGRQPCVG